MAGPEFLLEVWPEELAEDPSRSEADPFSENGAAPRPAHGDEELGEQAGAEPFLGKSHDEVLAEEALGESHLVEDLVEIGVVGVVAGIPETYKSWVAQAISVGVGRGEGEILGCKVALQGPVGYFWQDDSRRNEVERIKTFERVRENPPGLPLRWFLNEGLQLPSDLERLRATAETFDLRLIVLDSFYNIAFGDLKDRDAGLIVAALKAEVCDPTECTVLIVDHMPWATDANRSRLRAYGDVHKGAATRFGIYIDADRKKLWVEARGNNIRGFKRSPAYWDAEALELRLFDTAAREENEAEFDQEVLAWLIEHVGRHSTTAVREAIPKRAQAVDRSLERLKGRDEVRDLGRDGRTWSGQAGTPRYWIATVHADSTPSALFGTGSDEVGEKGHSRATLFALSHPRRGDRVARDGVPRSDETGVDEPDFEGEEPPP